MTMTHNAITYLRNELFNERISAGELALIDSEYDELHLPDGDNEGMLADDKLDVLAEYAVPPPAVLIGRTRERARVLVTAQLTVVHPRHMADHTTPPQSLLRLSLTGEVVPYRSRVVSRGGQIPSQADLIPAPGWTTDDLMRLWDIWDRWHLNDMSAACVHMDGSGPPRAYAARAHVTCPVTGERYGQRWWARELPQDVHDFIAGRFE